ncbi:MAG TPA: hypothetical protein VK900_13380 [Anaerolineales bacterium]|nr:hypothetical protein [Anaerolineales bacterium]
MTIYTWRFYAIPDPKDVEAFIEEQMPLFSRNARSLTGADGEPIVDLMRVEHNCGAVNLEFQFNGIEGQSADLFCFPGYYPGDMDDEGNPLSNCCDTQGYFYGRIVEKILDRARRVFDMEVMINVKDQRQLHPAR